MAVEKLIQRPLYVFDLPEELLHTLRLEHTDPGHADETSLTKDTSDSPSSGTVSPAKSTSCSLCGLTFSSLEEQRSHARSDLHKYNLRQKLRGHKPVGEADFEQMIGDLDESISGSDSDESSEDDESTTKPDVLSSLLRRQARLGDGEEVDGVQAVDRKRKRGAGNAPLYWFKSSKLPSNTNLGIYRAIFSNVEQEHETSLTETIQKKQLAPAVVQQKPKKVKAEESDDDGGVPLPGVVTPAPLKSTGPHYFLCMIGGGHFAALLVSLTPKKSRQGGGSDDRSATVLAHKTFHRYTTRRKQGGSQSANDNSKGNAHSAGAGIRRYNEAALETDIRTLLADWKPWIDSSELLFVRASGSSNRRTLFGPYDGQVLTQKDERLRGFPFNTRRATQSELMRAFVELTRVKISVVDEAALARQAAEEEVKAQEKAQQAAAKTSTPKKMQLSKEEEEAALHTTQIQALIRRSKAPALLSYLQSNSLSSDLLFSPADRNHHAPTALHLASSTNSAVCVAALLMKAGANPTIRNDDGRSAYELAGDRATRDAFCLARGKLGEARWQWDDAAVPVAITQAEVDARMAAEKDEKLAEEKAEKERRAAEMQRLRKEDDERENKTANKKFGAGRSLTSTPMTAEQRRMDDARGMTDEMRLRIERERRARAAEERMRRLKGGS